MKKRVLLSMCMVSCLVFAAAGCGNEGTDKTMDQTSGAVEAEQAADTGAETEENTETEGNAEDKKAKDSEKIDQVIYDQGGLKVTADSYYKNDSGYYWLVCTAENQGDAVIGVEDASMKVNGINTGLDYTLLTEDSLSIMPSVSEATGETLSEALSMSCEMLPAGETTEFEISLGLGENALEYFGNIQTIDFRLEAAKFTDLESAETFAYEIMEPVEVAIQTEAFSGELSVPEFSGTDIYNKDGVRIVLVNVIEQEDNSRIEVSFYAENTSGKTISMETQDLSVNDFMVDAYIGINGDMTDGSKYFDHSFIDYEDMSEVGSFKDIQSIDFTVEVIDAETYETLGSEEVSYTP